MHFIMTASPHSLVAALVKLNESYFDSSVSQAD